MDGNKLPEDIQSYHENLQEEDRRICIKLAEVIDSELTQAHRKVWHAHPVWFLDNNPIVGYSRIKKGLKLMFWSGQSFSNKGLKASGKFKAAEVIYNSKKDIDLSLLVKWLKESRDIQWDYKNIVKRKGKLLRLK